LDDRACALERARELLLQLEHAALLYRDVTDADLLQHAKRLLPEVAAPSSWLEVASAQLVFAVAAHAALEEQLKLGGLPRDATLSALASQTEHGNAARAALVELDSGSASQRAALRGSLDRWLTVTLPVLGETDLRGSYLHQFERITCSLGLAH
jgi:hypothetical protein